MNMASPYSRGYSVDQWAAVWSGRTLNLSAVESVVATFDRRGPQGQDDETDPRTANGRADGEIHEETLTLQMLQRELLFSDQALEQLHIGRRQLDTADPWGGRLDEYDHEGWDHDTEQDDRRRGWLCSF